MLVLIVVSFVAQTMIIKNFMLFVHNVAKTWVKRLLRESSGYVLSNVAQ
jgi:hypothetical protein